MAEIPVVPVPLPDMRKLLTLAAWAKQTLQQMSAALSDPAIETARTLDTRAMNDLAQAAAGLRDPKADEPLTEEEAKQLRRLYERCSRTPSTGDADVYELAGASVKDGREPAMVDGEALISGLVFSPNNHVMQSLRVKGAVVLGTRTISVKFGDKTGTNYSDGRILWKITDKGKRLLKEAKYGETRRQAEQRA